MNAAATLTPAGNDDDDAVDVFAITSSVSLSLALLTASGGRSISVPADPFPATNSDFYLLLDEVPTPRVVVLDPGEDLEAAFALNERFKDVGLGFMVVLASERANELGLSAMRAGFADILDPTSSPEEMAQVIDRARSLAANITAAIPIVAIPAPVGEMIARHVITVVSPKGGVGKTTVATNLATGLASTRPNSTVLVDLDIQFGDVASGLNLTPEFTLANVVRGAAARDSMVLKSFLTHHETGLSVVCGVNNPVEAGDITADQVSNLLHMLAAEFEYVVIDTAPGLSEHTLAAMDMATDLVFTTSMDVPGVRGLKKELDALRDIDLLHARTHIVLNMVDSRVGLTVADVEATIDQQVHITIPRSARAALAVNEGVPLLQSMVRDSATTQLRALAERFAPLPGKRSGKVLKTENRARRAKSLFAIGGWRTSS